jgi:hypothetical protein
MIGLGDIHTICGVGGGGGGTGRGSIVENLPNGEYYIGLVYALKLITKHNMEERSRLKV